MRRCLVLALCALLASTARAQRADSLADLPLTIVPARGTPSDQLAVILSGDGGWAKIDKVIADSLAAHGIAVVGLSSRDYLTSAKRTPESASNDLARILRTSLGAMHRERALIVGYSRGADIGAFMINRLPGDLKARVSLVALLGPAHNSNFTFHLVDLVSNKSRKDDLMNVPEIEALKGRPVLCFYGADEKDSACRLADRSVITPIEMSGGHHFDGKYGEIATRILGAAGDAR